MSSFLPVPDRVAFSLFGLDIMWYGVMLVTGMVLGTALVYLRAPRHGLERETVLDIVLYCIPFAIVGARLYYVVFEWERYAANPLSALNLRGGGLAIHGGLIFGIGLMCYILYKRKQNVLKWMDMAFTGVALAQAIGRWGNYFNSEAHGTPTDLPWAIEVDGQLVHPTFLYESLWCFLLCIFLVWLDERNLKNSKGFDGQLACLYVILYSVERFFVEGLRTDSLYIGPSKTIRQAQLLSVVLIVAGIAAYFVLRKRNTR